MAIALELIGGAWKCRTALSKLFVDLESIIVLTASIRSAFTVDAKSIYSL